VERLEAAGVPLFFEEGPEPAMASLMFRAGICDESAPRRGITHLVEHLAFFEVGRRDHPANGFVALSTCTFFARGTQAELQSFLTDVTGALANLPLDRVDAEKNVLQREAARDAGGVVDRLMAFRFGTRGFGGVDVAELGLRWLGADDVEAWGAERFTAANAALWFHGPAPPRLERRLPDGVRHPLPAADPLPGLELPAFVAQGRGGVAASSLGERSWATTIAAGLVRERLHDVLRVRDALAYDVWTDYQPLGAIDAHVAWGSDCEDSEALRVAERLLDVIEEMADEGAGEERVEWAKGIAERGYRDDPDAARRELDRAALAELIGADWQTAEQELEELRALRAEEVRDVLRRANDDLVLVVPTDTPKPRERFRPLERAPRELPGRRFKAKALRQQAELRIGEAGITWRSGDTHVSIPADEVAAVIEGGGRLVVIGIDQSWVEIVPDELRDGDEAAAAVEALSPGPLVPSDDMRAERVRAVAEDKLTRRWLVSGELAALPDLLELDERPLTMAEAARGMRVGLLVLTEARLLWVFAGGLQKEELLRMPRAEIRDAGVKRTLLGSKRLRVVLDGEQIEFEDFKPKERLGEFAAALSAPPSDGETQDPLT
jgi:zinc protease